MGSCRFWLTTSGVLRAFHSFYIRISDLLRAFVVEEREKRIATIACYWHHFVQKRTREYDRMAWRSAIALVTEFGKAKIAAFVAVV